MPTEKVIWTCSHGRGMTAWEMEMGMTSAAMSALMEEQEREHYLEADKAEDAALGREHALGQLDCPWPWYAESPVEVMEPEVLPYEVGLWCA